ncbi:MAG TPA: FHA domain-containing protein [Kofleriaceae bacterium]|nr:FHA domain-containing protein [Kofleriaceae bacterium]
MSAPFGVEARCERASISSGKSTLWASIRIDPKGKALENDRAPLAVALVLDISGSMAGDPIAHVIAASQIVSTLLDERDKLAIVTFSNHAGVRCGLTTCDADGRKLIGDALRAIQTQGGTNMHAGMEAAAGILATAPAGLRKTMVVLSDGQPNVGLSSAEQLAQYTTSLRPIGVSTLGFGLHHDEHILTAISTAGSGRYAYVPDPMIARVDLARAALAHGGIVAEGIQLEIRPAEGVEVLRIMPAAQLRVGGSGLKASIGDVFIDEFRVFALELALDVATTFRGNLAEIRIEGRSPDGKLHQVPTALIVDVHGGPHTIIRDAQRDILFVRAMATRVEARAHADRGATPAAASLLREMIDAIDKSEGFVRDDASPLAEMREQLQDEVDNYERKASQAEQGHRYKMMAAYTPTLMGASTPARKKQRNDYAPGFLVGLSHGAQNRKWQLFTETSIGRSQDNEIPLSEVSLSRRHCRIMYMNGNFVLSDLGSTNGCSVNGQPVWSQAWTLKDGDIVQIGDVEMRLELKKP